jgi:hypothetical protein
MRKIVLSIAFALFALPVAAAELECTYETTPPAEPFIQAVMKNHPDLDETQRVRIASMYELAYYQNQLANDEATAPQDREFAKRTQQVAMQMVAIQLHVFESLPQMESVLERMRAEEAAGLTRVSAELEPDVRHTARTMLAIGLIWGDLSNDVLELSADRFIAVVDAGNFSDVLDSAERTMCTLESGMDVLEGVTDFFPNAAALAYVEHLNY